MNKRINYKKTNKGAVMKNAMGFVGHYGIVAKEVQQDFFLFTKEGHAMFSPSERLRIEELTKTAIEMSKTKAIVSPNEVFGNSDANTKYQAEY